MKKIILIVIFLVLGWLGFSYVSAAWTREQFTQEVDSLLASPRDLTETGLPPLILNKAGQFGIELLPEDIRIEILSADRETTTSRLLESKGFKTDTRILTLHIQYRQSVLGTSRLFTLDRERSFTAQIGPSAPRPDERMEVPAE
ncbi:MAG: hypothetical protein HY349_01530 [Nitrospirae bacterium]|nr:hypothetical protein [Nitrospirota bacterium]